MIAIISDIHGNYPALKSVIEEIKKNNISQIISLGDVAGYYCFINECIELLRSEKVINIMGNHDYYLTSGTGCPRSYSANFCLEYQKKVITDINMSWLKKSVPFLDMQGISLRHGGWNDPLDEYIYNFAFDEVDGRDEKLFVSGHTHKQCCIKKSDKEYMNPGSVGQPRDYFSTAAYAIVDDDFNVSLKRVEYSIDEVVKEMKKRGFQEKISACLYYGTKIGEVVK